MLIVLERTPGRLNLVYRTLSRRRMQENNVVCREGLYCATFLAKNCSLHDYVKFPICPVKLSSTLYRPAQSTSLHFCIVDHATPFSFCSADVLLREVLECLENEAYMVMVTWLFMLRHSRRCVCALHFVTKVSK